MFVELTEDEVEKRVLKALEPYDKYIMGYEQSDVKKKWHYQGVIFIENETAYQTYKKTMEQIFVEWKGKRGNKGNGLRSFAKVLKEESYKIYVSKDFVKWSKGFTDEELKELKDKSYKKGEKKKKDKEKPWFQVLIEHCLANGVTASSAGWDIAASVIDAYREYTKCEPNDFQIKCYAKSIQRELVYARAIEIDRKDIYTTYLQRRARDIIGDSWTHVQF